LAAIGGGGGGGGKEKPLITKEIVEIQSTNTASSTSEVSMRERLEAVDASVRA
jgi:hypothetical protein